MTLGRIIKFTSRNAFTNLAAEERLFERTTGHRLLFYINRPCIVLGRTQNPFYEADVTKAVAEDVPIVRRKSGGGTVVHDEGNLNMCFMSPRDDHDPCFNSKLVASVLREDFGINASVSKRGDIYVDSFKISGSAYRMSKDRAYHHATLLVNSDLPRLRTLLASPLRPHIEPMGTKSIRAQVANLRDFGDKDIEIADVIDVIATRWQREAVARVQQVSVANVEKEIGGLQDERGTICSPEWIFGQTPRFTFKVNVGLDESAVTLHMRKGCLVESLELSNGNAQNSIKDIGAVFDTLSAGLVGVPFDGVLLDSSLGKAELTASHSETDLEFVRRVRSVLSSIPTNWQDEQHDKNSAVD